MKICIPYIYKVVFKPNGKTYIGSKSNTNGSNPETFWKEKGYFTSSLVVKDLIAEFGISEEYWDIEILKTFSKEMIKEVRKIENDMIIELVEKLGVENVLNKKWVINGKVHSNTGIKHTEDTIKKLKEFAKDKVTAYNAQGERVRISKEEFDKGGYTGINTGKTHYHNPATGERITLRADEEVPIGFIKGLIKKPGSGRKSGYVWITNGSENKTVINDEEIPEGWFKGRSGNKGTKWTEERTNKFKASLAITNASKPQKEKKPKRARGEACKGVKHTEERIMANKESQRLAKEKREQEGVAHGNKGRKKSPEETARRLETRRLNKIKKNKNAT